MDGVACRVFGPLLGQVHVHRPSGRDLDHGRQRGGWHCADRMGGHADPGVRLVGQRGDPARPGIGITIGEAELRAGQRCAVDVTR